MIIILVMNTNNISKINTYFFIPLRNRETKLCYRYFLAVFWGLCVDTHVFMSSAARCYNLVLPSQNIAKNT